MSELSAGMADIILLCKYFQSHRQQSAHDKNAPMFCSCDMMNCKFCRSVTQSQTLSCENRGLPNISKNMRL